MLITEKRRGYSFSRQNCEGQVAGEGQTVDVNNIIFRFVLPVINTIIVCKHYTLLHDTLHTPQSELSKQTKYFFLSNIFSSQLCICKINVFPPGSAACFYWTASVSQAKNEFWFCFLTLSLNLVFKVQNNKSNYVVAVY